MKHITSSSAFNAFIEEYNSTGKERGDGYSEIYLKELKNPHYKEAEKLLLDSLDLRAIDALAVIKSKKSITILENKIHNALGVQKIAMAHTLFQLSALPYNDYETIVINEFRNSNDNIKSLILPYLRNMNTSNVVVEVYYFISNNEDVSDVSYAYEMLITKTLNLVSEKKYIKSEYGKLLGMLFESKNNALNKLKQIINDKYENLL